MIMNTPITALIHAPARAQFSKIMLPAAGHDYRAAWPAERARPTDRGRSLQVGQCTRGIAALPADLSETRQGIDIGGIRFAAGQVMVRTLSKSPALRWMNAGSQCAPRAFGCN